MEGYEGIPLSLISISVVGLLIYLVFSPIIMAERMKKANRELLQLRDLLSDQKKRDKEITQKLDEINRNIQKLTDEKK